MEIQREALFGTSAEQIAGICRVNRTTAMRWKQGRARMPFAAFALVQQSIEGFLPPGGAWSGWRFGRDGRLYAPDLARGFTPEHIRQLDVLLPMFSWSAELRAMQARALDMINARRGRVLPAQHVENAERNDQA